MVWIGEDSSKAKSLGFRFMPQCRSKWTVIGNSLKLHFYVLLGFLVWAKPLWLNDLWPAFAKNISVWVITNTILISLRWTKRAKTPHVFAMPGREL